jgi:hypothetical protein
LFALNVPAVPSNVSSDTELIHSLNRVRFKNSWTFSEWWCRFTRTSLTSDEWRIPNQYSSKGRSPIGIKHFGQLSVSGLSRVPNPAAKSKALTLFKICSSRFHNNLEMDLQNKRNFVVASLWNKNS